MKREICKLCADSLRTFSSEEYGVKLKSAHAHELVAAYFGYQSKNALLADENYPISALAQADIIVMVPDEFFDKRRMSLHGLSPGLPDNSVLFEAIHRALVADEWLKSPFPPFRDFEKLAFALVTRSHKYQATFPFHREFPLDHFVAVESAGAFVRLTVTHAYNSRSEETLAEGRTTITLPRVAGRVGYGEAVFKSEKWSGGMRRTLKSLGVRP